MKKLQKNRRQKKWDMENLRGREGEWSRDIEHMTESGKSCSIQERWSTLKNTVVNSAEKVIGFRKRAAARKPWMIADMIDKMEERRKWGEYTHGGGWASI